MYSEIYVHVFAIIKQPTNSILASALCKKIKQYMGQFSKILLAIDNAHTVPEGPGLRTRLR